MNFKMKRAASAGIARKAASVATTFVLATSSVPAFPNMLGALVPQVALADEAEAAQESTHEAATTAAQTGIQLAFNDLHVASVEVYFASPTDATHADLAKVIVVPEHDGTGKVTAATTKLDNATVTDDLSASALAASATITGITGKCAITPDNVVAVYVKNGLGGTVSNLKAAYSQAGAAQADGMTFSASNILAAFGKTQMKDCTSVATVTTAETTDKLADLFAGISGDTGTLTYYTLDELAKDEPKPVDAADVADLTFDQFGSVEVTAPAGSAFKEWAVSVGADPTDDIKAALDLSSATITHDDLAEILPIIKKGAVTLKATYRGNAYTLKLDAGAGAYAGPTSLTLVSGDDSGKLITAVPTLEGATFLGWACTGADGTVYRFDSLQAAADHTHVFINNAPAGSGTVWDAIDSLSTDGGELTLGAVYSIDSAKAAVASVATLGAAAGDGAKLASGQVVTDTPADTKLTDGTSNYFINAVATAGEASEFAGWYALASSEAVADVATKGVLVTEDATLTADDMAEGFAVDNTNTEVDTTYVAVFSKVAAKKFTISFDLGAATLKKDGKAITARQATSEGDWATVMWADSAITNNYEYAGREFKGWSLEEGGALVTAEEQAAIFTDAQDVTLHAVWDVAPGYYVLLAEATPDTGGTVSREDVTTAADPFATYENTATAAQGYTFDGWVLVTTDSDGNDKLNPVVDKDGKQVASETITGDDVKASIKKHTGAEASTGTAYQLVAQFHADRYTVVFGEDGGTEEYTVDVAATLPEGAVYTDKDGNVIKEKADLDKLVTKDHDTIVLKAKPLVPETPADPDVIPEDDPEPEAAAELKRHWVETGHAASDFQHWVDLGGGELDEAKWAVYDANGKLLKDKWVNYTTYANGEYQIKTKEWYYLGADGEMVVGKAKLKFGDTEEWYYMNPHHDGSYGKMYSGWLKVSDNEWYYCDPVQGSGTFGKLYTGSHTIEGSRYYFFEGESHEQTYGKMAQNDTINGIHYGADGRATD